MKEMKEDRKRMNERNWRGVQGRQKERMEERQG